MIARWQRHWHDTWGSYTHRQQVAATAAAIAVVLGLLAWPVVQFWGLPRLKDWRVERTMAQAAEFATEQDYRSLLLSIRRVSQMGSRDVAVWRRIAGYLTQLGSPEALRARETVAKLAPPEDLVAQVELAQTALLFGEYQTSQAALDAAKQIAASSADYQKAAATLALYLGDVATLKTNLAALVAADPANTTAAYDLALARLWSRDAVERQQGLDALVALLDVPDYRVRATVELLKDAARTQAPEQLDRVMPDILRALDFPARTTTAAADLPRLLLGLKTTAKDNAADVAMVAHWMADIRLGRESLQWIHTLPAAIADQPVVQEAAAEIAIKENIPTATSYYLLENALGELPPEASVLAAGAQQLHASNRLAAAEAAWDEAVDIASTARNPGALKVLARVATLWGRPKWAEEALRAAIRRSPDAFWAYAALRDQLLERDAPHELWALYGDWIIRQPEDITVVNQWLRLGCALPQARDELIRRAPTLLADLPHGPRTDAARAAWAWETGDLDTAREFLRRVGESVDHAPDAAYWAAVIEQPAAPNQRFPALARLQLLSIERARLTADPNIAAGMPRNEVLREIPSLRVR